jgi:hypothetical protein
LFSLFWHVSFSPEKKEGEATSSGERMCCCDGDCRPLGWLLGLPFALLAVLVSLVGAIIWIVGWVLLISLLFLPVVVVVVCVSIFSCITSPCV